MVEINISEEVPYDLSIPTTQTSFQLTNTAYDVVIDDLPFIVKVTNQDPYRRETAPYKKDQFDNSPDPGEQSLTGWWLRSQTSWHNGSGITFYEPGTDFQTVAHRFADSRGIDPWTIGEATLLPEVVNVYNSANLINTATGKDGNDVLVSADNVGGLSKISFSGDNNITVGPTATGYTIASHTAYPFTSVTTDGTNYYATCGRAIHVGPIGGNSDVFAFKFSITNLTNTFIKYVKGSILLSLGRTIYDMTSSVSAVSSETHTSAGINTLPATTFKTHLNSSWIWNDATASPGPIYISGNAGNNGEVWQISFDETTNAIDMPGAQQVLSLPDGETINKIQYYLGVLALGTSKGLRICPVNVNGQVILGPLLYEASAVNGFTVADKYIYAATTINNETGTYTHGCLIRVDLSTQFDDGTYAYAYDLEYRSSVNLLNASPFTPLSSEAVDVQKIGDRIVMVIKQAGYNGLRIQSATAKRNTGFFTTGKIRYGMVEPKFFRYINVQCTTGQGDTVQVYSINKVGTEASIATLSQGLSNQDIFISNPSIKQEWMSFKFVLNNVTDDQSLPVVEAYQIKATPATRRQRLYQFPLSCYDNEMDKFNSVFGYTGRAVEYIQRLESIEETGKFVTVSDYRTGEQFQGVIEEVRFSNESSPDKNSSGFGGLLLVTVRKL